MHNHFKWALLSIRALGFRNWLRLKLAENRLESLPEGTVVRLHAPGVEVYCRAQTSDIVVFYQIFVEREYRCLDHVRTPQFIIDCGANVGYSSAYFLARYPDARLVAVEPDSGNFELLKKNLAPYKDRIVLINSGVWSKPGPLVIANPEADAWAFTVREAKADEAADFQAVDIPSLIRDSGETRVSILKVDIEGSETEVFRESPWLQEVDHLVIELHGPACEDAVFRAVNGRAKPSRCGELTVFDFVSGTSGRG
jgi:FkbM family methyltransferase